MAVAGGATTAYTYRVVITDDERRHVEQRKTTALSSNCAALDDALADLDALKPTMVQGSDAAAVNGWIAAQGWKLQAMA